MYIEEEVKCGECGTPIGVGIPGFKDPKKPMCMDCYYKSQEYEDYLKRQKEMSKPYTVYKKPKPKIKRYCWFHRNDIGEKVDAVCYWYTIDGFQYHACQECADRYGKTRKVHYYPGYTPEEKDSEYPPFDPDCDHEMHKKNMVTLEDARGMYDIVYCIKCKGECRRQGL